MTHRIKTIAVAATASALTVAGMAVAHGGDGKGDRHSGPTPFGFAAGKSLTYSETHLQRDGEDVTVRVDQGRVVAATASSIAIARNDGETVEVPVDGETEVWGGWWRKHGAFAAHKRAAGVADIPAGKRVLVLRSDDDEAAEAVVLARRHWRFHDHDRGDKHGFDHEDDDGRSRDRDDDHGD